MININAWYTDEVDVYRVTEVSDGDLTRHERSVVAEAIPCRMYTITPRGINMSQTSSSAEQEIKLMADLNTDIKSGDELKIRRGARVGRIFEEIRAFAGEPVPYVEPIGGVIAGLAHLEIRLLREERVK